MRLNWIGWFSVFLVVHLYYDCTISHSEALNETDNNVSLAYTPKKEDVPKIQELIEAKFKILFSEYEKDQSKEKSLPFSRQEDRQKERQKSIERSGFKNLDELALVRVNEPLMVTSIRLDDLQNYKRGESKPKDLMRRSETFIVPVQSDKNQNGNSTSQTFVVVVPAKDANGHKSKFRIIQYGPSTIFRSLFEARQGVKPTDSQVFIGWIPALTQFFLGEFTADKKYRIQIIDNGRGKGDFSQKFKGEFHDADEIFEALAKEVREKDYNYPSWDLSQPQEKQSP